MNTCYIQTERAEYNFWDMSSLDTILITYKASYVARFCINRCVQYSIAVYAFAKVLICVQMYILYKFCICIRMSANRSPTMQMVMMGCQF